MKEERKKEDAHLICPIAYSDPDNIYNLIESELTSRIPLKNIIWKNPVSSVSTTLPSLPIRFMEASHSLFKDIDHPFRWFLAPYVNLFLVGIQSLDAIKTLRSTLRTWVDSHSGVNRSSWLIVYIPLGTQSMDTYSKIYAKIASEFCIEKAGDRSVMVFTNSVASAISPASANACATSFDELFGKLSEGIVSSFHQRTVKYDSDIRRLDSLRGTPQLDFRQLFLVKESLALMHQMMQCPNDALLQYEELEALLAFAPSASLPSNDWPMVAGESVKNPIKKKKEVKSDESTTSGTTEALPPPPPVSPHTSPSGGSSGSPREKDAWTECCKQGDDVLVYSINEARIKLLKNKMSLLELHRYIFSRQFYFLQLLDKPMTCAEKGYTYIKVTYESIYSRLQQHKASTNESTPAASTSFGDLVATPTLTWLELRFRQCDLWTVAAGLRIVLDCWGIISDDLVRASEANEESPNKTHIRDVSRKLCDILQYITSKFKLLTTYKVDTGTFNTVDYDQSTQKLLAAIQSWENSDNFSIKNSHLFTSFLPPQLQRVASSAPTTPTTATVSFYTKRDLGDVLEAPLQEFIYLFTGTLNQRLRSMMNYCWGMHTSPAVAASPIAEQKATPDAPDPPKAKINYSSSSSIYLKVSDRFKYYHALLSLTLLRLRTELELLSERRRFAYVSKLINADILLCNGYFSIAMKLYNEAFISVGISSSLQRPASSILMSPIKSKLVTGEPAPIKISSIVNENQLRTNSNSNSLNLWPLIRCQILRKVLICARCLDDVYEYSVAALQLIALQYHESRHTSEGRSNDTIDKSFYNQLLQDVIQLVSTAPTAPSTGTRRIILPLKPFFETAIKYEVKGSSKEQGEASVRLNYETKIILEEKFSRVPIVSFDAGVRHEVEVQLHSAFNVEVVVDSIQIIYRNFSVDTIATSLTETPILSDSGSIDPIDTTIVLTPVSTSKIMIKPGSQTLLFHMLPPCTGEFRISQVQIMIGTLVFEDIITLTTLGDVADLFTTHGLLCIEPAKKLLSLTTKCSSFTPLGQEDIINVTFETLASDVLQHVELSLQCNNVPGRLIPSTSSSDVSEGSASVLAGLSQDASSLLFSTCNKWAIALYTAEETASTPVIDSKNDNVLQIANIRDVDGTFHIQVPFSIEVPDSSMNRHTSTMSELLKAQFPYEITVTLCGTLHRNGCVIPFTLSSTSSVKGGYTFHTSSSATSILSASSAHQNGGLGNSRISDNSGVFMNQLLIANITSIPFDIMSYELSCINIPNLSDQVSVHDGRWPTTYLLNCIDEDIGQVDPNHLHNAPLVSILANEEYGKAITLDIQYPSTQPQHSNANIGNRLLARSSLNNNTLVPTINIYYRRNEDMSILSTMKKKVLTRNNDICSTKMFKYMISLSFPSIEQQLLAKMQVAVVDYRPAVVLGVPFKLTYKLNSTGESSLFCPQVYSDCIESITIHSVELPITNSWLYVGCNKRKCSQVVLGNNIESQEISFTVVPVEAGLSIKLPNLRVSYAVTYRDSKTVKSLHSTISTTDSRCVTVKATGDQENKLYTFVEL